MLQGQHQNPRPEASMSLGSQVGMAISELPKEMTPLKQLKRVYDNRREMVESGKGIDWGFAEALAFGTLLSEGACCCSASGRCMCAYEGGVRFRRSWPAAPCCPKVPIPSKWLSGLGCRSLSTERPLTLDTLLSQGAC